MTDTGKEGTNMAANAYQRSAYRSTTTVQAYRSAEIEGLSQRDLLVKLFEGIERFLGQARTAMEAKQIEPAHNGCLKARAIIMELLSTLNFDQGGDIAKQLRDLYLYLLSSISEANLRKDPALITAILPVVETLRSAWQDIPAEEANTTSLPGGTQRTSHVNLRT